MASAVEDFGEIPPIKCYPNLLNQVFMNILVNAYQSIEDKGRITIKTKKINENIVITILDSGHGISKENLKKQDITCKDCGSQLQPEMSKEEAMKWLNKNPIHIFKTGWWHSIHTNPNTVILQQRAHESLRRMGTSAIEELIKNKK